MCSHGAICRRQSRTTLGMQPVEAHTLGTKQWVSAGVPPCQQGEAAVHAPRGHIAYSVGGIRHGFRTAQPDAANRGALPLCLLRRRIAAAVLHNKYEVSNCSSLVLQLL